MTEEFHTKRHMDYWLVSPRDHVDRETWERLKQSCREAGGWYNRRFGRVRAGFAFNSREEAAEWAEAEFGAAVSA